MSAAPSRFAAYLRETGRSHLLVGQGDEQMPMGSRNEIMRAALGWGDEATAMVHAMHDAWDEWRARPRTGNLKAVLTSSVCATCDVCGAPLTAQGHDCCADAVPVVAS